MPTTKIPFKTAYGERERHYIPTGNGIEEIWEYEINKYGQKVLVKTGEYSLYEKIQESLEETKIENILARVADGDTTVMRPDGMYADMTEAPKNLLEARQQMQKLENLWNGLDNEIKKKIQLLSRRIHRIKWKRNLVKRHGTTSNRNIKRSTCTSRN